MISILYILQIVYQDKNKMINLKNYKFKKMKTVSIKIMIFLEKILMRKDN